MAGTATVIRLPINLEVIQSSVTELNKILSNLKPNTNSFRELQKLIRTITEDAKKIEFQSSKPIVKGSQLAQTEKTINHLEETFSRVNTAMSHIRFNDILKLDPSQLKEYEQLQQELRKVKDSIKAAKEEAKDSLLSGDTGTFLREIDPTIATKSFDAIIKAVSSKSKEIVKAYEKANQEVKSAQDLINKGNQASSLRSSTDNLQALKEVLGQDYQKFFTKKDTFKANGANAFANYLKNYFNLEESDVSAIRTSTAETVRALLANVNSDINQALSGVTEQGEQTQIKLPTLIAERDKQKGQKDRLDQVSTQIQVGQDNITKTAKSQEGAIKSAEQALKKFENTAEQAAQSPKELSNAARQAESALSQMRSALETTSVAYQKMSNQTQFISSLKMTVANFMGFTQVLNLVKTGVRNAINHIKELDEVMNGIAIVTDMSTGDLWDQIGAYSDMASKYGVSIKGAYEVSKIYYQQGLETADVMTLTNETLKLSKISGMDYATATDYMTTAIRGFKMEMQDAATVVDVYSALAAHTAVSQEELAIAMSKTASSMGAVGSTFEEASAMIGTMVAVTRESATNIGSAMKSIASRYGELTKNPAGFADLEGEAYSFNKVDAALQSVGISMKTVDGQFRSFTDVIIELGEKWDTLDSTQQRYIATQFAGNRQQSRFLALVSNVDLLKSNLDVAENSEDTGTVQTLKSLDSIQTKLEQVKVAYQQFYTSVGAEDVWKAGLDGIRGYIETLNSLPKLFGKIPLGAITVIADTVTIIKSLGWSLIQAMGKIWPQLFPIQQMQQSMITQMEDLGKSIMKGIKEGMESEQADAEKVVTDTMSRNVENARQAAQDLAEISTKPATTEQKETTTPTTSSFNAIPAIVSFNEKMKQQITEGMSTDDIVNAYTQQFKTAFAQMPQFKDWMEQALQGQEKLDISSIMGQLMNGTIPSGEGFADIRERLINSLKQIFNVEILKESLQTTFANFGLSDLAATELKKINFDGVDVAGQIQTFCNTIINAAGENKEAIQKAFEELGLVGIGGGVTVGIQASTGAATNAASNLGTQVLQSLASSIVYSSPSPYVIAMFETGIGEAIEIGLDMSSESVISAAQQLGLEVTDSLQEALKNQTQIKLDDFFDTNVAQSLFINAAENEINAISNKIARLEKSKNNIYASSLQNKQIDSQINDYKFQRTDARNAVIDAKTAKYKDINADQMIATHTFSSSILPLLVKEGGLVRPSSGVRSAQDQQWGLSYGDIEAFLSRIYADPRQGLSQVYTGDAYTPTIEKAVNSLQEALDQLNAQPESRLDRGRISEYLSDASHLYSLNQMRDQLNSMYKMPFMNTQFRSNPLYEVQGKKKTTALAEDTLKYVQNETGDTTIGLHTLKPGMELSVYDALGDALHTTLDQIREQAANGEPLALKDEINTFKTNLYQSLLEKAGYDLKDQFNNAAGSEIVSKSMDLLHFVQKNPTYDMLEAKANGVVPINSESIPAFMMPKDVYAQVEEIFKSISYPLERIFQYDPQAKNGPTSYDAVRAQLLATVPEASFSPDDDTTAKVEAQGSTMGSTMSNSVAMGVKSAEGAVKAAGQEMAQGLIDATANTLQYNSPSPIFIGMGAIGVGDGLVDGIMTSIGKVQAAAKACGLALTKELEAALKEPDAKINLFDYFTTEDSEKLLTEIKAQTIGSSIGKKFANLVGPDGLTNDQRQAAYNERLLKEMAADNVTPDQARAAAEEYQHQTLQINADTVSINSNALVEDKTGQSAVSEQAADLQKLLDYRRQINDKDLDEAIRQQAIADFKTSAKEYNQKYQPETKIQHNTGEAKLQGYLNNLLGTAVQTAVKNSATKIEQEAKKEGKEISEEIAKKDESIESKDTTESIQPEQKEIDTSSITDGIESVSAALTNGSAEIAPAMQEAVAQIKGEQTEESTETAEVPLKEDIPEEVEVAKAAAEEIASIYNEAREAESDAYQEQQGNVKANVEEQIEAQHALNEAKQEGAQITAQVVTEESQRPPIVRETTNALQEESSAEQANTTATEQNISMKQRFTQTLSSVTSALHNHSSSIATAGSAISMLSGLFGTASRSGQIFAGAMQGLAGVFKLVSAAVSSSGVGAIIMGIATAAIAIKNAIDLIVETDEEKLDRLTKEAEKLSDAAKVSKSEYKTLQQASKKYDELKEKRFDSEEDAQAYQEAVDDLTSKFPELIASFDEAGNAILNEAAMTDALTEARNASADAAIKAAQAEVERQKQLAKTSLAETKTIKQMETPNNNQQTQAGYDRFYQMDTRWGMTNAEATLPDKIQKYLLSTHADRANEPEKYKDITDAMTQASNIMSDRYKTDVEINDPEWVEEFFNALNSQNIERAEHSDQAQLFLALYDEMQSTEEGAYAKQISYVEEINATIDDFNQALSAYKEDQNEDNLKNLTAAYENVTSTINKYRGAEYGLGPQIAAWEESFGEVGDALGEYTDALGSISVANGTLVNATLQASAGIKKFVSSKGMMAIVTKQLTDSFEGQKEYTDADKYVKNDANSQALQNAAELFYSGLSESNQKLWDTAIASYSNYTWQDVLGMEQFHLDTMPKELQDAVQHYFDSFNTAVEERLLAKVGTDNKFDVWLTSVLTNHYADLSVSDERIINSIREQYQALAIFGEKENSLADAYAYHASWFMQNLMQASAEAGLAVTQIIEKNGFTQAGLEASAKEIGALKIEGFDPSEITQHLISMSEQFVENVSLNLMTLADNFVEGWSSAEDSFSKAVQGMNVKDASKWLQENQQYFTTAGMGELNLTDLQLIEGKFYATAEQINVLREEYINQYKTNVKKETDILEEIVHSQDGASISQLAIYAENLGVFDDYIVKGENGILSWREGKNNAIAQAELIALAQEKLSEAGTEAETLGNMFYDTIMDSFRNAIDVEEYLNAITSNEKGKAKNKLVSQLHTLDNYKDLLKNLDDATASQYFQQGDWADYIQKDISLIQDQYDNAILSILESGGQNAVNLLKQMKPDATSEQLEAVYNNQINKLREASEDLGKGVGEVVTGIALDIMRVTEGFEIKELDDGTGVILAVGNMVAAYEELYARMAANAQHTVADLNGVYAQKLTAEDQSKIDIVDTLKSGTMSYSELGDIFSKQGILLEDAMADATTMMQYGIQRDFLGNIKIINWKQFASNVFKETDLDALRNNPEYLSAFSAYNDGLIEMNKTAEDMIVEEVNSLKDMKRGSKINLTYLWTKLEETLATELTKGFQFEGYNGNVSNMGHRTIVSGLDMAKAFPDDYFAPTDYATIYGMTYSAKDLVSQIEGNVGMVFASLDEAGQAVSDLDDYVSRLVSQSMASFGHVTWETIKALDAQQRNLLLYAKDFDKNVSVDDVISETNIQGIALHEAEESAYTMHQVYLGLLEAYGATFEEGILTLNDDANLLGVAQTLQDMITASGIDFGEDFAEIEDTIHSILQAYSDAIKAGIQGGLSNAEAADLQAKAYDLGLGEIHFEKTVDGLKLSQTSAIALYQQLKKIDSIQAQLVFDDLADSLAESNENFTSTNALLSHMVDLRKKLSGVDGQISDARRQQYEAELELAKEIVSVRSGGEDDSFKFMENDIPGGQKNMINYAKNWTKAMTAINDAYTVKNTKYRDATKNTATGYMDYTDFYNIVNELNNMAGLMGSTVTVGKTIEGDALELDGSLKSAADLITAGIETMTAVDTGDMMVNIGALGISLSNGANDLNDGIQDGIKAVAEAQISALDGMIAMLELIVAMESLGDVAGEDMTIELPDIVWDSDNDGKIDSFTEKYDDWLIKFDHLYETNKDLQKVVDGISINGTTWREWLKRDVQEWSASDAQLLDALYQAAISTDWNLDDIGGSLQKLLNSGKFAEALNGQNFTIDIGDVTYTISNGVVVEVADWSNEQTKEILEQYKKNHKGSTNQDAKAAITQAIQNYLNGEGGTGEISVTDIVKIRHSTLIKKNAQGEDVIIVDGKEYKYGDDVWNKVIQSTVLKDQQGIDSNATIVYDDKSKTSTTTIEYGKKYQIKMKASVNLDGQVDWGLAENIDTDAIPELKGFTPSGNASTQAELLSEMYNYVANNTVQGAVDNEGNPIEFPTKESWIYQRFGVHVKIQTEVLKDGETVEDPSKDAKFRTTLADLQQQQVDLIEKTVIDKNSGKATVELENGYSIQLDMDDISYDGININENLFNQKLAEVLGIDAGLKDTIKAAITDALTSLTNIEPGSLPALAEAVTNLATALTSLTGLNLSEIVTQLQSLTTGEAGENTENLPSIDAINAVAQSLIITKANTITILPSSIPSGEENTPSIASVNIIASSVKITKISSFDTSGAQLPENTALLGDQKIPISNEIIALIQKLKGVVDENPSLNLEGATVSVTDANDNVWEIPVTGAVSALISLLEAHVAEGATATLPKSITLTKDGQQVEIPVSNVITALLQTLKADAKNASFLNKTIILPNGLQISVLNAIDALIAKFNPQANLAEGTTSLGDITLAGKSVNVTDVITAIINALTPDASKASWSGEEGGNINLGENQSLSAASALVLISALALGWAEGANTTPDAKNLNITDPIVADKNITYKQGVVVEYYQVHNDDSAGQKVFDQWKEELSQGTDYMNAINKVVEGYSGDDADKVWNYLNSIYQAMESGGYDLSDSVKALEEYDQAVELPELKLSEGAFDSITEDVTEGGEQVMEGMAQGMEKNSDTAVSAITAAGDSVIQAGNTSLGVASPSIYMIAAGLNLILGLVQGITENESQATAAAGQMGTNVIEAISSALTQGLTTLSDGITKAVETIDQTYNDLEQKTVSVTQSVKSHWETLKLNIQATVELIRQLVQSLQEKISITWSIGGDDTNAAGTGSGAGTYGELTDLNNYISEVMASMEKLEDGSYTMKLPKLTLDTSATNLDTASIADTIVEALSKTAIDVIAVIGTITPDVTNAVIDEAGISEAIASKEVQVDEIKAVPSKVDASDLTKIDRNLGTQTIPTDAKMMIGNPIKAVPSRLQLDLSEVSDISALDDGKKLEVDVDITPAEGKISDLQSQIDSLKQSKKVPVIDVDTSDAKGKLEEIIELIDTIIEKATLIITIDAADETSVTQALLDKIMNTLIIIEGKNNIPLTITLKADGVLGTLEKIAEKLQEIAANANLGINIEANGEEPEGGEDNKNPEGETPTSDTSAPEENTSTKQVEAASATAAEGTVEHLEAQEAVADTATAQTMEASEGIVDSAEADTIETGSGTPAVPVTLEPEGEIKTESTPTIDAKLNADTASLETIKTTQEITPEGQLTDIPEIKTIQTIQTNGGVADIPDFETVQTIVTHGGVSGEATGNIGLAGGNFATMNGLAKAGGTPTLMGELGPELVVSNGKYVVVGQTGPEMVNLANDAIVFNHLQTEQLLTKGMSKERGRAVTNERNAVSFAKGNISGPAQASASAALSALKQIRSMWQSLLSATAKDLAGTGGSGGGGGGDNGNSSSSGRKSFIEDVERWYNLLQEIAKLEKIINHEETLRGKLEGDLHKNGKAYYQSQKTSLAAVQKQIKAQEELNISRREYFNVRRKQLNEDNGPFNQLYEFDENGQLKYKSNTKIKGSKATNGYAFLSDLMAQNSNTGKPKYTAEEQYNILKAAGFEEYMKYDSSGNEITLGGTDSDDGPTEDDYNTYYTSMTQAFWDRVEAQKTEMQTLYDSVAEGEDSLLELEQQQNEIMQAIYDNQKEVEESVLSAIEDMKQREIDALQDERDKLEDSVNKYIDGLTDALDKEKEMYDTQEDQNELDTKKRRLGILQRSGASAADIYSLQKEITESEKDMYFDAQQAQIDAIQEASQLEIDRLDSQIAIMQETLDYQKEMGLLWYDVYEVMAKSDAEITQFIMGNNSEFWADSPLTSKQNYEDTMFKASQWEAFQTDMTTKVKKSDLDESTQAIIEAVNWDQKAQTADAFNTYNETMKKSHGKNWDAAGEYRKIFESTFAETGDRTKAATAASAAYEKDYEKPNKYGVPLYNDGPDKYTKHNQEDHYHHYYKEVTINGKKVWKYQKTKKEAHTWNKNGVCKWCGEKKETKKKETNNSGGGDSGWSSSNCSDNCSGICKGQLYNDGSSNNSSYIGKLVKKAAGGYVGHGIYELGEQGEETVLTAEQTRVLRNNILSNRPNSLISLLKTYNEGFSRMSTPLTGTTSEDNSTNIDKVELTMNVQQIASDYDAKRAGEQALAEMMRIAKKTSANNSVRR